MSARRAENAVRLPRSVVSRLAPLSLLLLVGTLSCGLLFPPDPIDFRSYELPGVSYVEGVEIVREVTRREFTRLFGGGFTEDWDATTGNLVISPIEEPRRRLRMHLHVEASTDGTRVDMLALVEHLDANLESGRLWSNPKMDVPLEQKLYDAFLAEMVRRRGADAGGAG